VPQLAQGEVGRAAEAQQGDRYGLDMVVIWPRLYPSTCDSLSEALTGLRDQLDAAARLCVVLLLTQLRIVSCC
jgi:hypothetical protein